MILLRFFWLRRMVECVGPEIDSGLFVGSVAEWSIAPVLKTGKGKPFVSSNLTASASNNTEFVPSCGVSGRLSKRGAERE